MPPSLLSAVASTALLATCALASDKAYQKYDSYKGNNFFNHFDFWESKVTDDPNTVDPTSGFINYRNESDAWDLGLIGYKNGLPYMGVDHTNIVDSDGPLGRSSVRLESKKEYDQGLFIFDMAYLPKPASGSWPAIWTYGENWPYTGDIDIYENWNDNFDFNRQTLHTGDGCTVQGSDMSAEVETHNCNALYSGNGQSEFQGCSADDHGEGAWGDASGGVYAVEWNGDHIKMWHFRSNKVPSDITQGCPDPTGWGQPTFNTAGGSGSCDIDSHYGSQKIVFNLDFCGVAGDFWAWSQSSAYTKLGETSCTSYVANNPHTFKDVYFLVNSVDIYKFDVVSSSTSSSLLSTSTSSVASSVSTSSVITTSSSIASTTSSGIGSSTSSPVSESSSLTSSTQSTVSGTSSATTSYSASSLMNTSSSASLTRSTSTMSSYITSSTSTDDGDYCEDDITSSPVTLLSSTSSAVSTSTASVSGTSSLGGSTSTISLSIATSLTGSASSSIASATFSQAQSSESSSLISTSSLTFGTTNRAPHFVSASSSANAGSASATSYATSTIYTTAVYTITSCKPEVTDCPAKLGKVTTETIAASTTVCPVTETSAPPNPTITSNLPVGYTTSTRYVTKVYTITSCAPTVTNCHVGSITTEVKTTLTVCPITATTPASASSFGTSHGISGNNGSNGTSWNHGSSSGGSSSDGGSNGSKGGTQNSGSHGNSGDSESSGVNGSPTADAVTVLITATTSALPPSLKTMSGYASQSITAPFPPSKPTAGPSGYNGTCVECSATTMSKSPVLLSTGSSNTPKTTSSVPISAADSMNVGMAGLLAAAAACTWAVLLI